MPGAERLAGLRVKIVLDPNDFLASSYRTSWAPRAYLLDRHRDLRWFQPFPDYTAEMLLAEVLERIRE